MKLSMSHILVFFVLLSLDSLTQVRLVMIQPEKPRIGDSIRIQYDPSAPKALFPNVKELTAEVLLLPHEAAGKLLELPMHYQNGVWQVQFVLRDSIAIFFVRFITGELVDDNDGVIWNAIVYSPDGIPRKHAHMIHAGFWKNGGNGLSEFHHSVNGKESHREFREELRWHADLDTRIAYMHQQVADTSRENLLRVAKEADSLFHRYRESVDTARRVAFVLRRMNPKYVADSTRQAIMGLPRAVPSPRDSVARLIEAAPDDSSRFVVLARCVRDFPADTCSFGELYIAHLLANLVNQKEPDEAIRVFDAVSKHGNLELANMAWNLAVIQARLERALVYAEQAVSITRKPDTREKPAYLSRRAWDRWMTRNLAYTLDVYGFVLTKIGRHVEALAAHEEAVAKSGGTDVYMNERYIQSLISNDRFEESLKRGIEFISTGNATDSIAPILKSTFAGRLDTLNLDAMIASVIAARNIEEREFLHGSRLNLPLPPCEYETLDGQKTDLSAYRGKVVLLEFWATWCAPCRMSLPRLQQFFEEKREDPRLAIVALNTSEVDSKIDTRIRVRKFLNDHAYTFPVLLSDRGGACFDVNSLPSYVLIDREGRIQFKGSGSMHHHDTFKEMQRRLDLLLSNQFYQR